MLATRAAVRRGPRLTATAVSRTPRCTRRFDSSYPERSSSGSGAVAGAIAGGITALIVGYGFYRYSGTQDVVSGVRTVKEAVKENYQDALKRATASAPKPNEAIQWLRQSANHFLGSVPGAKSYIDSTFDGLEQIQKQHGAEVDKIVKKAYTDLKQVNDKEGSSMTGIAKAWEVIQRTAKQIGDLAGGAGADWLHSNPELKKQFGGKLDSMKKLAEQYGPEAQKKVDETWKQVQDILKGGLNSSSMEKIRKLIESKLDDVKKIGEQALNKSHEEARRQQAAQKASVSNFVDQSKKDANDFIDRNKRDAQGFFDRSKKDANDFIDRNKKEAQGFFDRGKSAVDNTKQNLRNASANTASSLDYDPRAQGSLDNVWKDARTSHYARHHGKDGVCQLKETTSGHTAAYFQSLMPGGADLMERIRQMKVGEAYGHSGAKFRSDVEGWVKDAVNEVHDVVERGAEKGRRLLEEVDRKYAIK